MVGGKVKYGAICLILFGASVTAVLYAPKVAALSWAQATPTVYRNEPVEVEDQPDCPSYEQKFWVEGLADKQTICMLGSGGVRIGSFREDGGTSRAAVEFPLDSDFHVLSGVCEGVPGCFYSSDRDELVSRYGLGVRVYSGVTGRIHQRFDPAHPLSLGYDFDTSDPSYASTLPIGAMALSLNGEWLAMEIKNLGTGLVNLETGAARRVIAPGYQYGRGFDPHEELAVSNDGSSIVVMGDNAGLTFVSVNSGCGDNLVADLTPSFSSGTEICRRVNIDSSLFVQSFSVGLSPKFDDTGGQLEFVAGSRGFAARRVILRAAGYEAVPELSYLAMGDSFSSGEGETDNVYYEAGTDDGLESCHVSTRSYPFLLGVAMQMLPSSVKNVACSGAKTRDIHPQEVGYWGQGGRLGSMGLNLSSENLLAVQTNGLLGFLPGRVPQEAFVQRYQPDVVTVGVGGNDAGLMDKLKVCAMPGTCEWAATQEGKHAMGLEIQGLFYKLVNFYHQLKLDGPFAHFYAIGYPEIIDTAGSCDPLTSVLFSSDERSLASEGIAYLNRVIKAAANSVKIPYFDIEQSLSGHELCEQSSGRAAVNGLRLGNDIALASWLPMLKIIGKESFHPNSIGHELIAKTILQQQPDLRVSSDCAECEAGGEPPPLPASWAAGKGGDASVSADFIDHIDITKVAPAFAFSLPAGSLEPESTVRLEVHSGAVSLGEFIVGTDGSLHGEANLPTTLEEGFHTVHLYGSSFSHRAVDVYQVISFDDSLVAERTDLNLIATSTGGPSSIGVLGDSTDKPTISAGKVMATSSPYTRGLSLIAFVGAMILAIAALIGAVVWRLKHNFSQDRGG